MLYRFTILAAILFAVVCCLTEGVLASGYEALCVADFEIDNLNESTTDCCDADLNYSVPLYVTCANMSDGQLEAFIKCCPTEDDRKDKKGGKKGGKSDKSKNDKRSISRRNNKRRHDSQ
ncbi:hypothetical protein BGZ96_009033 [Linnemannia gamsii]|uniref:Uncharacterized protein n=1 Tax=Linnemannia gamsii TaxID=64522 RepID=A0ABQ7KEL4_9FUNG|nr:hypothetical protein BGZ96_009033 [Linnemannia gamsii]